MHTIDLYPLRDERTVLDNPHKGWYWHYIDCGLSRPRYRDNAALIGDAAAFPGLRQLYLRFDWVDFNPAKGVYNFDFLDEIMDEWGSRGFSFSMRMCAFQTEVRRWNNNQRATPDYVREAGAQGFEYPITDGFDPSVRHAGTAWEPDYGDEIFLGYAAEALARLGERYNGDERLEYIDIGTFGRYGEGHTQNGKYSAEILRRHIDMTADAFPDTLVLINDDMLRHNPAAQAELTDYCLARGIGIRDDSICVAGPSRSGITYDTLRDPRMFDDFNDRTPVDIEFAHGELIPEDVWRGGFPAMEALRRTKATFAGFHDYPGRFLAQSGDLAEYAANRLGYWFRPDALSLDRHGGTLTVTNLGWAPSYRNFEMRLYLVGEDGERDMGIIGRSAAWREQSTHDCTFTFAQPIPAGNWGVQIALSDERGRPIRLALKEKCEMGGRYEIGKIEM